MNKNFVPFDKFRREKPSFIPIVKPSSVPPQVKVNLSYTSNKPIKRKIIYDFSSQEEFNNIFDQTIKDFTVDEKGLNDFEDILNSVIKDKITD